MVEKKMLGMAVSAAALAVMLAGCAGGSGAPAGSSNSNDANATQSTPTPTTVSLDGDWKQSNGNADTYQAATIKGDVIQIDWVSNGGDTRSIYWIGSVAVPAGQDSFTFVSTRDKAKTDNALMASTDATKKFTYSNGELSYSASALGTTTTVRMKKQ